jgi:predicted  nucleic acid-binding Zn-ribbon protein
MDEQAVKQQLQRWFKRFRSGKPDEKEKVQLLIGGALYIILQIIALASLEWKKLGSLIPLEVLRVVIEIVLGGTAIFLALRVKDAARRGRLVFLCILGRVAYASLAYPLIVFALYSTQQAAAVMFAVGVTSFSFLVVFLPTIFAAALRVKSLFPELQEGNRVATLSSGIITVIVLPFLAISLGLVLVCKLVLPELLKVKNDLAGQGLDTSDVEPTLAKIQAVTHAGTPLVLGFFITFVAFIFAMFVTWSMRHRQLLRFKLFVARVNFRFAYLAFAIGVAALLFRVTPGGFWKNVWNYIPGLLTMVALAGIQIPALTGWWRMQLLNEVRGDYSPVASSRIRRLMTRCVQHEFVPEPDGLALQRVVTGLDVMERMPPGDTSAAVALRKDAVSVKYKPSGEETAVELLEPEDIIEDRRILGSFKGDIAAAKRAFELRRHGGDVRANKRRLQQEVPSLYLALGQLADEKGVEHEATAETRATIAGIHRELRELDDELKKQDAKLGELTKELDAQRRKHEGQIAKAKDAYDKAAAELTTARGKRGDVEGTLQKARTGIVQAEQRIAEGTAQIEATGETALSDEAKKQVKDQIKRLEAQIKSYKTDVEEASSELDGLRKDEEAKASKAVELQRKLEDARGAWGEVRNDLQGQIVAVTRQKDDLARRGAGAQERLADARHGWGKVLYEEAHDVAALKKAVAPIDENLAQQAKLEEELKTAAAERETLRPGVQRFTLVASIAGEALILAALFIILIVYAL